MSNFIPSIKEQVECRPGFVQVPIVENNIFKRFWRWLRGEPNIMHSMKEYNGVLYIFSDKGLFCMHQDGKVRPVKFEVE